MKAFETLTLQKQIKRQMDQLKYVAKQSLIDLGINTILLNTALRQSEETLMDIYEERRAIFILLIKRIALDLNSLESRDTQLEFNKKKFAHEIGNAASTVMVWNITCAWLDNIISTIEQIESYKKNDWCSDVDATECLWELIRII